MSKTQHALENLHEHNSQGCHLFLEMECILHCHFQF